MGFAKRLIKSAAVQVLSCLWLTVIPVQVMSDATIQGCEQEKWGRNLHYIVTDEDMAKVYGFLENRLQLDDLEIPNFVFHVENQYIEEEFFDTDELTLLADNARLSIQTWKHLSNYNEQRRMVIPGLPGSLNNTKRIEFKTKNYNRKTNPVERHPLLGIVKRSERDVLLDSLSGLGITPVTRLVPSLRVIHENISFLLREFNQPYIQVVMERSTISAEGITTGHTTIRFEVLPAAKSEQDKESQKKLENSLVQAHCAFKTAFPGLKPAPQLDYQHYYQAALKKIPYLPWVIKYPHIFDIGQALLLTLMGVLPLYLVINRQKLGKAKAGYRLFSKVKSDDQV